MRPEINLLCVCFSHSNNRITMSSNLNSLGKTGVVATGVKVDVGEEVETDEGVSTNFNVVVVVVDRDESIGSQG